MKTTGVRGTSRLESGGGVCTASAALISNQSNNVKATKSGEKIRVSWATEPRRQLTQPARRASNPKTQAIKQRSKPLSNWRLLWLRRRSVKGSVYKKREEKIVFGTGTKKRGDEKVSFPNDTSVQELGIPVRRGVCLVFQEIEPVGRRAAAVGSPSSFPPPPLPTA